APLRCSSIAPSSCSRWTSRPSSRNSCPTRRTASRCWEASRSTSPKPTDSLPHYPRRSAMSGSSQKFIARNRAPRVQIEYDCELYGSNKKMQIPFVMGVMAAPSGKPAEPLAPVADRKFLEIDVDNFDERLKAMKPRVAFAVPNTLTGEGNMSVDITFENMSDFSPEAVAKKVGALNNLLEAR